MNVRRTALLLALALPLLAQAARPVREIRVTARGEAPVDPASVLAFVSVTNGQAIARDDLARDVKELQKSGRFSYVATKIEDIDDGIRVIYEVEQKPRVRKLEITGADEIGNRKVRDLLELGAGDLVDDATLRFKEIKVRDHYRKKYYPEAKLDWTIAVDRQNGLADVVVRVVEGKRAHVRNIAFIGNTNVPSAALRKAMKQNERGFFSWITGSGTYDPETLDADIEGLRRVCQDRGLLDAQIGEPVITNVSGRSIDIEIPVTEGSRYDLGNSAIRGATFFKEDDLRKVITNRADEVASMASIEATAKALKEYYGNRGYIATQVKPVLTPVGGSNRVDVSYEVTEGRKASIRDILIRGNSKTKDKVIRRELTIYPGEEYNESRVRTSERRLRNLGFFSLVNSVPEETSDPSLYDLAFEVEEQRTGTLLVGTGFSSIDSLIGFVELSQGNFDIANWPPVGAGQKLKLRGTIGTKRTDAELSFVEPWFLDRKLSLGVDLFRHDRRYLSDEYDQRNTGMNISLGRPLGTFNRVNLIYGLENYDIYNVDDEASDIIKAEEGSRLKSSLTAELIRDTRDSVFIPTRGMRTALSAEYAGGPLGAETDLYKLDAHASKYVPLWWDHVFNLRGWWSVVEGHSDAERVPIFDRLFLGGARTLRGFKYREVGPKDEDGEPVGGLTGGMLSFEYIVPIVEKVRAATFYDVGMVYEEAYANGWSDLNSDWGIGVRLDIPGFPMRLDYAWPIETDEYNDRSSGRFQFSLGYSY